MSANTLHDIFTARALQQPDRVAIEFESYESDGSTQRVTYHQLNARADALATLLRKRGVCRDMLVAMRMERSIGAIVAMLGILKAGGAYVPIDPTHPPDRQSHIFVASSARILITDAHTHTHDDAIVLPPRSVTVTLDTMGDVVDGGGIRTLPPSHTTPHTHHDTPVPSHEASSSSSSLAYVLFTSGSTGTPKGVCLEHRNVTNILQWFARELDLGVHDTVVGLTTFTFDISVLEVFMTLLHGARLYLVSADHQKDPRALAQVLSARGVTVFQATPATYEMLMAVGWTGDPRISALCGGEAFRLNLAPVTTKCRSFWNVYGPTETCIWSTCYKVTSEPSEPLPLGEPIAQTYLYILDGKKRPVPDGVQGELYIGGVGLARGYWKRPELTAEKFIPSPFRPGERIYATGDIVMRAPDGSLKYVGRSDNQVKIQGYRVELGEIETQLQKHPDVETAVVTACDGVTGKVLVGYIKPRGYTSPTMQVPESLQEDAVSAYLGEWLAPYMVPSHYVYMTSFPLNPNGKIDRKALPMPFTTSPADRQLSHKPTISPMARIIMDVIHERTGVVVGPYFELRSLRIDSVSSVVVVSRLQTRLRNFAISPTEFFGHATLQDLADHLYRRILDTRPELIEELKLGDPEKMFLSALGSSNANLMRRKLTSSRSLKSGRLHSGTVEVATSIERALAGLRGVLIVWVILDHFSTDRMQEPLGSRFSLDVNFFAILSGLGLYIWYTSSPKVKWWPYFRNKFMGLFPVFYLAMVLGLPRLVTFHYRLRRADPVPPALQKYNYRGSGAWQGYFWDGVWQLLALPPLRNNAYDLYYANIQWGLYLIFPVLMTVATWAVRRSSRQQMAMVRRNKRVKIALFALMILLSLVLLNVTNMACLRTRVCARTGTNLAFVPELICGICVAGIFLALGGPVVQPLKETLAERSIRELAPVFLLAVFSAVTYNPAIRMRKRADEDVWTSFLVVPLLGMAFILVLLRQESYLRSVLFESYLACFLGDLSLNIYLLHNVLSTYYARMAVEAWPTILPPRDFPLQDLKPNAYSWIQQQSWLFKLMCLVSTVAGAWAMQHYFMNKLVVPLMVSCVSPKCVTSGCARHAGARTTQPQRVKMSKGVPTQSSITVLHEVTEETKNCCSSVVSTSV